MGLDGLAAAIVKVWEDLTPPLDDASLRLLKAFVRIGRPSSVYRAAREAGLTLSLAYKKARGLESLRLIHSLSDRRFYSASVKACIALLVRDSMGPGEFSQCLRSKWPLDALRVSDDEALALVYALGVIMRGRGLDLTKATICGYDEASMHVFKFYLASVLSGPYAGEGVKERIARVASEWGVEPRVVAAAFRAAIKGVLSVIPPTIITPRHRILAVLDSTAPRLVAVDCRAGRCRYYEEEVGLTCPAMMIEVSRRVGAAGSACEGDEGFEGGGGP